MRRAVLFSMVLVFGVVATACTAPGDSSAGNLPENSTSGQSAQVTQTQLADGQYPVQQVTYDDATGEYRAFLLNTPAGQSPTYQTANIPMARLTEEEISKGQGSYLKIDQGQPSLHITEDFKIEYVHNVTETVPDPQTGQPQTVVVRQESSFWTPFAGALIGQAVGSMLFTPHYYMPPVYQPGVVLTGYGGYGRTYNQAVSTYQSRYKAPPAEVKNRQTFRTTGGLRSPRRSTTPSVTRTPAAGNRSTGSGYGGSTLRQNGNREYQRNRPSGGFGSTKRRAPVRMRRR